MIKEKSRINYKSATNTTFDNSIYNKNSHPISESLASHLDALLAKVKKGQVSKRSIDQILNSFWDSKKKNV